MGFTANMIDYIAYRLVTGNYLDLLTAAGATPSASLGYEAVPCYWESYPGSATTDQAREGCAVFTVSNGVLTNKYDVYFPEADDPNYDYESGSATGGWGELTQWRIRTSAGTVYAQQNLTNASGAATTITVPQDYQVRFPAGSIRITLSITEVSS